MTALTFERSRPSDPALVSCIIGARNAAPFIANALQTVFSQTYKAIDVIVVDDGSTDDTAGIVRQRFGSCRLLRQEPLGIAAARNAGLNVASGAFIGFIDADDEWPIGRTTALMSWLKQRPSFMGCFCHWENYWEDNALGEKETAENPQLGQIQNSRHFTTGLYRREVFEKLGGLDTRYRHCSEQEWLIRAQDAGFSFGSIPEIGYRRRIHASNASRSKADIAKVEMAQIVSERLKRRKRAAGA